MAATDRTLPMAEVIAIARELFAEAYEGHQPNGSWFVSTTPDAGLFATVAGISAEDASRPSRTGGPSIAAHVEHLRWSLANVNATMRGEPWQPDWSASWSVSRVDDDEWQALRTAVEREFADVRTVLESDPDLSDPLQLRGVIALAPHAAYHLAAIRVMAKQLAS